MKKIPYEKSLAALFPELIAEWHPTLNGDKTPYNVSCGSNIKVWWILPYEDPKTGKHFDFVWSETIKNRVSGYSCPFLTGKKVWAGFNDLATTHPEIAKEWHPTKNGNLKPTDVSAGVAKNIWWLYPYDDPKTGKHFDFEWEEKIYVRTNNKYGCPFLGRQRRVWPGFNDLETTNPKLIKEWHPTKNGKLKPTEVVAHSDRKVWWILPYDDPKTGKHFDFVWSETIRNRAKGYACPYLMGKKVWPGFNDLATNYPELAKEWHPTKNGRLKPTDVSAGSQKKVWWHLPYDDPETGKHFEFEWEATINHRVNGTGCPYLGGLKKIIEGFNDLATTHPELARQWHPTKNGKLKPTDVFAHSNKRVWWSFPYDDPKTGRRFDFEWQAEIGNRVKDQECPFLSGKRVWTGFNDLVTTHPELAKEWHPTKNGELKPTEVSAGSDKRVWWYFPYDDPETGRHFDFEWQASISNRVIGRGCPYLRGLKVWVGYNDLASNYPELVKEWNQTKNPKGPLQYSKYSNKKVWWKCSNCGYEYRRSISNAVNGLGCKNCGKNR